MSDFEKHPIVAAHLSLHHAGQRVENDGPMYRSLAVELYEKLRQYEEQEALSQSKTEGAYVLHAPIQYMLPDAKEKDKKILDYLKSQLVKISKGECEGIILPAITDDRGNRMFTLSYVGPSI